MGNSGLEAIIFIIKSRAQLYLLILLLRFLMPWLGINFNNPLSQGILKLTSPLVVPLRRMLPAIGKVDTATLVVAFAIQYLLILVVVLLRGYPPAIGPIAVTAIVDLAILTIRLFVFAIIIKIVLSWISGPGTYNPAIAVIDAIAEPVLRPFRRIVPPMGGFDISPVFAIILLGAAAILLSGLKLIHY